MNRKIVNIMETQLQCFLSGIRRARNQIAIMSATANSLLAMKHKV